jgi:hypothetical protein
MVEEWKNIEGFEGRYMISNTGKVLSLNYKRIKGLNKLLATPLSYGYPTAYLKSNNLRKAVAVHILVAKHFLPNPYLKETVNHINGVKTDNTISNLEWATNMENTTHAYEIGLNDHRCKKVIDKNTGEVYRSIGYVSKRFNIPLSSLLCQLKGKYKNKTQFQFYNE